MSDTPKDKKQDKPEPESTEQSHQTQTSASKGEIDEKFAEMGKNRRVVLVEDDPGSQQLVKSVLEKVSFEVAVAANGKEAWTAISTEPPQLIIADVVMPEMDGFRLLKELRNNNETKDIPIVIISSRNKMKESFLVSGAEGFLSKPLDTQKLLETLSEIPIKPKGQPAAQEETKEEATEEKKKEKEEAKEEAKEEKKE